MKFSNFCFTIFTTFLPLLFSQIFMSNFDKPNNELKIPKTEISARFVKPFTKALGAALSGVLLVSTSAVASTQIVGGDLIRSMQRTEEVIMPEDIDVLIQNGSIPQLSPEEVEKLGAPDLNQNNRNELVDAMGDEEEENTVMPEDFDPTNPKTETIPFDEYRKNNPHL